jgi:AraC-like DNA-binding protein
MSRYTPLIRSASLAGYADLARHHGLDPDAMQRNAGVSPRSLLDPDIPISAMAVRQLLEDSALAAGVEDFGLQLAAGRRLSNMGPISVVMREAQSARQALESLCRYMRLVNGALLTSIEDYDDAVLIREEIVFTDKRPVRQAIEMAIGVLHRTLKELLGPTWRPRNVSFEHRPPHGATCHRAVFGMPVEFNASFNGVVCAAEDMDAPMPANDYRMASYARRFLDQALSGADESATNTVRQVVVAMLPGGRCTADQVARHLGVDRRTLHRRLSVEDTTFLAVLQAVRAELAARQILDGNRSLAELADLLGFSSSSAFAYWFRKHFGSTVSQWREASLNAERSTLNRS